MCGHCGCGAKAGATVVNLQTGQESRLAREDASEGAHEHVHGHAGGHSHSHPHRHGDAHEHGHGNDHHHGPHDHDHHDHSHADSADHDYVHEYVHGGDEPHGPGELIELEARILAKNDALAGRNRAWFAGREILALNLVSSPGAGKTTLLERTIRDLRDETALFVIEGDQATANDGERIRRAGAPAVQVNTGTGCHLEADMIAQGLAELRPSAGAVVMIENVGNLVCPAMFDLGEHAKVVILSVTEGEDKPLKYPHIFQSSSLMILNKIDLLPHLDFDVAQAVANAQEVNPDIEILKVSAKTGEGLDQWYAWIRQEAQRARDMVFAS